MRQVGNNEVEWHDYLDRFSCSGESACVRKGSKSDDCGGDELHGEIVSEKSWDMESPTELRA